ncbi:hypothetical protein GCM10020295_12290 [Streptomyces cinereospinus]
MWRDFAGQTTERADPEPNGHRGIGPFRFQGAGYRAALTSLLGAGVPAAAASCGSAPAPPCSPGSPPRCAPSASVPTSPGTPTAYPPGKLRGYGAVAFGRGAGEPERAAVRRALARAGVAVAYADGLAPVAPLPVAQIERGLDGSPVERRLTRLAAADGEAEAEVSPACRVRLTAYRLGRPFRTRTHEVFDGLREPGRHRVPLDAQAVRGEACGVARTAGSVPEAAVAR